MKTSFEAKEHIQALEFILSVFNRNLENLVCLIGDNVNNRTIANQLEVPLIGCASHKLNLSVNACLNPDNELLRKVNCLMGKLKDLKAEGKLRQMTTLKPLQMNSTRWSSIFNMIRRHFDLKDYLHIFSSDPTFFDSTSKSETGGIENKL